MEKTINEYIAEHLREMRLPVFAEEFEKQAQDPSSTNRSFEERLKTMVDREYDSRTNNTIQRYIREAKFYDSNANIQEIDYSPERKLDQGLIESLSQNEYIREGLNVIVVGASGSGKTWLGCALGVNACMSKYKSRYIRMPELLSEFEAARIRGNYRIFLKKMSHYPLLIIDEFLLTAVNETERNDLLELIEKRTNKKSTIFCSQWSPEGWYEKLGNGPIADAILDRINNSSYHLYLQGKSLREKYTKLHK
ncbi:IS21-like element helper ATPase IstB [Faecalicoccus pleomorphus]|uniref:IS21-like element helper ATPase IstB n=1 Tax=Faecalicoccus pleomorphus TaxID=1323 RepID=UPI0039F5FA61